MSSNDPDGILSNLTPLFPAGYEKLLAQTLQGHALLESSLTDLIAVEFGMEPLEAYTLVGRMDIRTRLDKLGELFKARNDKNGQLLITDVRKLLKDYIDNRNIIVHCYFIGHKITENSVYVYYGTSKLYKKKDHSDDTMNIVNRLSLETIEDGAKAFFKTARIFLDLAESRSQESS